MERNVLRMDSSSVLRQRVLWRVLTEIWDPSSLFSFDESGCEHDHLFHSA